MSWFRKGSGRSPETGGSSQTGERKSSPAKQVDGEIDPDTCLEVFKIHWKQALSIIKPDSIEVWEDRTVKVSYQSDEIETVIHNVEQMVTLLICESSANGMPGSILLYLLEHEILDKFSSWCTDIKEYGEKLKIEQLKMYEVLISQSKQLLLIHKPIIQPLLRLLGQCADSLEHYRSKELERRVVLVLHQLCACLSQQTLILESFFQSDADHGPAKFLIFSLLIPYVHCEGHVGQQARDALLLIMALSAKHDNIGKYVAENSHFCPVLATGLSGLYSSLPRKLNIPSDDWHQLTLEDIAAMPDLQMFLNSLEFCNAVAQVAHPLVRGQLITYIYNGFLFPVLGPALHQDVAGVPLPLLESRLFVNSRDEIIAATAYLELFLRRITEPALLRAFLKFVVVGKFDEITILDSLIARINTSSRLCVSSLSLFKTLVELNCEDVMFQLVFRYLIPCTHVMVSQRRAVKELDLYSKSAEKFLSLQPACCVNDDHFDSMSSSPGINKTNCAAFNHSSDGVFDSPFVNHSCQSSADSSHDFSDHTPSPSKSALGFTRLFRSNSSLGRSLTTGRSKALDSRTSSQSNSVSSTQEMMESNYMDYLHEAQQRILSCARACQNWSAPYDGELPPPDSDLSNTAVIPQSPSTSSVVSPDIPDENTDKSPVVFTVNSTSSPDITTTTPEPTQPLDHEVEPSTYLANSQLSKCLDLESFLNYLNTVELTSPSTPQDVEGCLKELDNLFSQVSLDAESSAASLENKGSLPSKSVHDGTTSFVNISMSGLDGISAERQDFTPVSPDSGKGSKLRLSSISSERSSTSSIDTRLSSVDSASSITGSIGKTVPRSPNMASKYSAGTPNIGPFLSALLSKLEGMMTNSLYVNLLLTGLISRLACYPKPLLRSFLLNHNLVFQPSVKSLMQVLTSVRQKVDNFAMSQANFDILLYQARKFLTLREQVFLSEVNASPEKVSPQSASKTRSQSVSEFVRGDKRRTSISELLFKKSPGRDNKDRGQSAAATNGAGNQVLERISGGTGYRFVNSKQSNSAMISENPLESMKTKNAVFCALILEEFVKELASLAQEHAVLSLDEGYSSS